MSLNLFNSSEKIADTHNVEEYKKILIKSREIDYRLGKLFTNSNEQFGLSKKELDCKQAYFQYVEYIKTHGRTIEDIYMLDVNKIVEISKLKDKTKYQKLEEFVSENKISVANIKRIVEIINRNNTISISEAYEQVKTDNKERRKQAKVKREKAAEVAQSYNSLKTTLFEIQQRLETYISKNTELEEKYKQLEAENTKLKEQIQTLVAPQTLKEQLCLQEQMVTPMETNTSVTQSAETQTEYLSHS